MRTSILALGSVGILLLSGCVMAGPEDEGQVGAAVGEVRDRVVVCHIPPGNPAGAHTIEISSSAVPAHLRHGDHIGACDGMMVCEPGATTDCYDGPAGTAGVGSCVAGTHTCNAAGSGYSA